MPNPISTSLRQIIYYHSDKKYHWNRAKSTPFGFLGASNHVIFLQNSDILSHVPVLDLRKL